MPIARNSFIQMSKLTNVKGRITYISSRAKQESFGESLLSTIKKNSEKAEQRENVLKREN